MIGSSDLKWLGLVWGGGGAWGWSGVGGGEGGEARCVIGILAAQAVLFQGLCS